MSYPVWESALGTLSQARISESWKLRTKGGAGSACFGLLEIIAGQPADVNKISDMPKLLLIGAHDPQAETLADSACRPPCPLARPPGGKD